MDPVSILTSLTVILVVGILIGIIAKKVGIPNMLLLILMGILLRQSPFDFSILADNFLITINTIFLK